MRKYSLILFFFYIYLSVSSAQDLILIEKAREIISARNEVIVRFRANQIPLEKLSRMMSIDKVEKDSIQAYIFKNQLDNFIKLNLNFRIVEEKQFRVLSSNGTTWEWNKYPTYSEYISMMNSFKKGYPSLCRIVEAGTSKNGRPILFARITGDSTKYKPSVMYSATMHGDELGGYVLMLRLIDYLLKNYSNADVKALVDNLDIWINPLANPDGTYFSGDNSVWSSTRGNANGVDLNRNFRDPIVGENPDGNEYQPETLVMMKIMSQDTFVLSANFHGGAEVVNYPWDSKEEFHSENDYFQKISKEYADTAQKYGRSGYFTSVTDNGYTNGYAWYPVFGVRQDYITYFAGGNEVTIEIDNTKRTPENQLPALWNYNFRSLLNYLVNAIEAGIKHNERWNWPVSSNIKNTNAAQQISIFPNPVTRFLNIHSDHKIGNAEVSISDINGKILIKKHINLNSTINVSSLYSGVYNITITSDTQTFKQIFIKK